MIGQSKAFNTETIAAAMKALPMSRIEMPGSNQAANAKLKALTKNPARKCFSGTRRGLLVFEVAT
jgi:hypothetical protein